MRTRDFIYITVIFILAVSCRQESTNNIYALIDSGEFNLARDQIMKKLDTGTDLESAEKKKLLFEIERMERIRKDFGKSEDEVLRFIQKYIPQAGREDLKRWEEEKSLEMMVIDGKKRYFNRAARNLFRINKECKKIWQTQHSAQEGKKSFPLDAHNREIVKRVKQSGQRYVRPTCMKITYTINVKQGVVPENETIRCWIPFPREIAGRQTDIKILRTLPETYQLAPKDQLQRSIYFEQPSPADRPARFQVEYSYISRGSYVDIGPEKVKRINPAGPLAEFLKEEAPHILFTDALKQLSRSIVGNETNPYLIARKLFAWVDQNIPWASAREYSTIRNIPMYAYEHKHGDCGIQTLLFITLCRINGIPARWQSGWEFQPPDDSMHDWGMIYFEPYGWMPMDVTYGLRQRDEAYKWFYLQGMDSYRLIFNDAISRPFFPPKKHFRSETVDAQRGEVEWNGGNLYFDQWDWNMQWMEVPLSGD